VSNKPSKFNGGREDHAVIFWLSEMDTYIEQQTMGAVVSDRQKVLAAISFLDTSDEEYFPTKEEPDQDMDTEDEEEEEDNEPEYVEEEDDDYREYLDPEDETDRDKQADVERILLQSHPGLLRQIQQVLQHGIGIRSNTQSYEERQNRRTRQRLQEIPATPYPAGKHLLNSSEFGEIDDRRAKKRRYEKARTITQLARFREMGWRKESILPLSKGWLPPPDQGRIVAQYDRHIYSGQFSHDGSFFYTASQDFKCRMYEILNPSNLRDWKLYKVQPSWILG
jgi:hypothetical protein